MSEFLLLWSKPLPSGRTFTLEPQPNAYLVHEAPGRLHYLSSDAITTNLLGRAARVVHEIPEAERPEDLGYTMGSSILFPGNKIAGQATINGARGFHPMDRGSLRSDARTYPQALKSPSLMAGGDNGQRRPARWDAQGAESRRAHERNVGARVESIDVLLQVASDASCLRAVPSVACNDMSMRAETASEQLFFTTIYLAGADGAGATWTGTGFVINYEASDGSSVPVLVTNRHVVEGAAELTVRLVRAGSDGQPMPQATETTIVGFGPANWLGHPSPDVDIAVLLLGPIIQQMRVEGRPPFYRAFTPDLMLTEVQAQGLDALESITFIGYPNGLYDTENFLPIARRGQTATPLQNNYRGAPAFLIDASVFGGSSGSPVLIHDRGIYMTRDGGTVVGSRLHLVGVLAAVHVRQVNGAVHELPARRIAVFEEPIDLGIVFKASAIQDCVNLLFARLGVRIAASTAPAEPLEGRSAS